MKTRPSPLFKTGRKQDILEKPRRKGDKQPKIVFSAGKQ
jgi:hypothetical protein